MEECCQYFVELHRGTSVMSSPSLVMREVSNRYSTNYIIQGKWYQVAGESIQVIHVSRHFDRSLKHYWSCIYNVHKSSYFLAIPTLIRQVISIDFRRIGRIITVPIHTPHKYEQHHFPPTMTQSPSDPDHDFQSQVLK